MLNTLKPAYKNLIIYLFHSLTILAAIYLGSVLHQTGTLHFPALTGVFLIITLTLLSGWKLQRTMSTSRILRERLNTLNMIHFQLREKDMLKSHYLGIVSHDIRNPLQVILSCIELLKNGDEIRKEEQHEFLDHVARSADQVNTLTEDILNVQMIDEGKLAVKIQNYKVHKILDELALGHQKLAAKKKINLSVHDNIRDQTFRIDKLIFMQVANNLISNAIKYTSPGGAVKISLESVDHSLRLIVQDNGPGIKPEEMPALFDRFTKLSNLPTGGESSTGLGLSIVKSRLEMIGGTIHCESEWGEGSTFTADFPQREE